MSANILTKAQAESIYSAMRALNNVSGRISAQVINRNGHTITASEDHEGVHVFLNTGGIVRDLDQEHYPDQSAFATAYALQHNATMKEINMNATAKAEWSHEGKDGNAQLIINLSDAPDDSAAPVIRVSGRDAEKVAKRLTELLNRVNFNAD